MTPTDTVATPALHNGGSFPEQGQLVEVRRRQWVSRLKGYLCTGKNNEVVEAVREISQGRNSKLIVREKNYFKNIDQALKNKKDFPSWISFDASKMEGTVTGTPKIDEIGINVDAQVVVEYYSR